MTRIAFVRHGRAMVAENLCIGQTDAPLSPEGAGSLRTLVACHPDPFVASLLEGRLREGSALRVVTSDLRRATASATIIAEAFGWEVHRDQRLREMHFGEWEGRSWAEIERDDSARLRDWLERWVDVAPPGGESAADVARRAAEWIQETLRTHDESIVVVSHAGWIRAALCHLLGRDLSTMFELPVDHARATIVDVTRSGCTIVAANVPTLDAIGSSAAPSDPACQPSP